jgi:ABC-type Fe3+-hydroxamate transport system substrate-binding protein
LLRLGFLLILAACWCGCAPDSASEGLLVDDLGRTVRIETPARRIVSLAPATTDLLFAVGAGDLVVGRTRWGTYPAEAERVMSVGDGLDPNVELIAAQRPDLVVFYASPSNDPAAARLETLGIATLNAAVDSLGAVPRVARFFGIVTGRQARADSVATAFEASLKAARARARSGDGPAVVMLTWDNPPIVIGGGSFLTELVELAGGQNVFGDIAQPSATVSIEAIAALQPDVFLIINDDNLPSFATRPEWQVVGAVANGRFVHVEGSEFSWPSVRAMQAVGQLRVELDRYARAVADSSRDDQ